MNTHTHTHTPPRSPGSSVHSSRGALREMPLRFLRTLLMTFPTPPVPEPGCCCCCCCCRDLTYARERRPAGGTMKRSCLIDYGVCVCVCVCVSPPPSSVSSVVHGVRLCVFIASWKTRPFLTVFILGEVDPRRWDH